MIRPPRSSQAPGRFDLGRLAEAWGWLVVARVALWLVPPRWVLRWGGLRVQDALPAEGDPTPSDRARARALATAVDRASRRVPGGSTCLCQALALSWMLRRRGFRPALRIGVARRRGRLAAHAWVEGAGLPDAPVRGWAPLGR
jgi:hypothetical protein